MDHRYATDDDDSADDIPGREEYDFTNAELARSLNPSVPNSYVIFKLIKAAPRFWKNSSTANCVLKIPLSPPGRAATIIRNGVNLSSNTVSAFSQGKRAPVGSAGGPLSGSQRVVTQPSPSSPMVMTIALHLEYLLPQSMLFRAAFPGSPHLHLITRIFAEQKEHAFDFSPPWSPFRWPAWRTPRIVPHTAGLPTAIVPVPHPPSLYAVVHYLYFGDLNALEEYIRTGTLPQSNADSSSQPQAGSLLPAGMPRSQTEPTKPTDLLSPSREESGRWFPPSPINELNTHNAQGRPLPPAPTTSTSTSTSNSFNLDLFTTRWQGVVNNAEYLGLPVRVRTWLSLFWKQECPDVEMPIFHEEVYFPPSPPSPCEPSDNSESEADEDDDCEMEQRDVKSPFKSPRIGKSKFVHSPIARSPLSPRKHDWKAGAHK